MFPINYVAAGEEGAGKRGVGGGAVEKVEVTVKRSFPLFNILR